VEVFKRVKCHYDVNRLLGDPTEAADVLVPLTQVLTGIMPRRLQIPFFYVDSDHPGGTPLSHLHCLVAKTASKINDNLVPDFGEEAGSHQDFEFALVIVGSGRGQANLPAVPGVCLENTVA